MPHAPLVPERDWSSLRLIPRAVAWPRRNDTSPRRPALMLSRMARIIASTAALAIFPATVHAEVKFELRDIDGQMAIFVAGLRGEIGQSDFNTLGNAAAAAASAPLKVLVLDSEGGDLASAMMIGRLVRGMHFDVTIPNGAVCYSTCVFILAAGIDKKVQGQVGIHRPYFVTTRAGSVAEAIKATKGEVERYLVEMNIPARLAEDMFSIDPVDMRILTTEELRDYRLNSMDYAEGEAQSVTTAEKYGLTREGYEAFKQDLNYSCQIFVTDPKAFKACAAEVADRHGVALPPGWLK